MAANGTLQLFRGTSTQNNAFTGAAGELTFDTSEGRIRVHNGATAGGIKIARLDDIPATPDLSPYARKDQATVFTSTVTSTRIIVGADQGATYGLSISGNTKLASGSNSLVVDTTNSKVTGSLEVTGDITNSSDARLKTEIQTLTGALDKVRRLRGASFKMDGEKKIGVIAQEVLEVVPEVVKKDGKYYSVSYGNLVSLLIEAIKELEVKVEALSNGL